VGVLRNTCSEQGLSALAWDVGTSENGMGLPGRSARQTTRWRRNLRVLVTGSRTWDDTQVIRARLEQLPEGSVIIHGGCRGADILAERIAKELGFEIMACPAKWGEYGRAAGAIRNKYMLTEGKPDLVLAFHLNKSPGTAHMIRIAREAGVEVEVF